jgi:hypothetical protein
MLQRCKNVAVLQKCCRVAKILQRCKNVAELQKCCSTPPLGNRQHRRAFCLDMMVENNKCVNNEVETTKTDAEISTQENCGGNERTVGEAKAASVDDEQMQWTNGETGKDCPGRSSPAGQKMDISPGKEHCRYVAALGCIVM